MYVYYAEIQIKNTKVTLITSYYLAFAFDFFTTFTVLTLSALIWFMHVRVLRFRCVKNGLLCSANVYYVPNVRKKTTNGVRRNGVRRALILRPRGLRLRILGALV